LSVGALTVFVGANRLQIGIEHWIPMVHWSRFPVRD